VTSPETARPVSATSPLRLGIYGLLLCFLTFVQAPGRIVADTKFDLAVAPGRFLARALEMWDGSTSFGQIQNQAYGYLFPMGPFFLLGRAVHLDAWVVQRLWWSLLLCLAFYGALQVARTLELGRPWTQVFAAFAYTLSVHATTVIGASSVELWPSALAPWVLWCVIRGTTGGSERRWAAAAGLCVAACGGVNAAAVLAVLPLSVCWLVTRRGSRTWVFFGWWVLCTVLTTLWWLVPLTLMGRYSFPFLDYIESAAVTTLPTGLSDVLGGTSDWVPYIAPETFRAGHLLATTPYLVFDGLVLAALGLAGIARADNPHRRFLFLGVVVGVMAVSFGYGGPGAGWFHEARQTWLDGSLAPLRNLHKFDNVLRLPLALGTAHSLTALGSVRERSRSLVLGALPLAAAVLALLATQLPWWEGAIAPAGAMTGVPTYWTQTADYLNRTGNGTTTLVLPAAAFGQYLWGSPRDDVLQPLLDAPWAVRNSIPLAQPGSVVLLDEITELAESAQAGPRLAELLSANGIGRLVVRNDLDRMATGAPDPVVLHQVLDHSPGLARVATFGPDVGFPPTETVSSGERVSTNGGRSNVYPAVEVYAVTLGAARAEVVPASDVRLTTGGPGSLPAAGADLPAVLGDSSAAPPDLPVALSDGLPRREENFAAVRGMSSDTMTKGQPYLLDRPVHERVMVPDQQRWQSTVVWRGIAGVTASSSQAWVDGPSPLARGDAPGAALDDSTQTAWHAAAGGPAFGQWWQVDLLPATSVDHVRVVPAPGSGVTELRLSGGDQHVDVPVPAGSAPVDVDTGFGVVGSLRITALASRTDSTGTFALATVAIAGVHPLRTVELPAVPPGHRVASVSLTRDPGASGCFQIPLSVVCQDYLAAVGDDGLDLDRTFRLPAAERFRMTLTGSWLLSSRVSTRLASRLPFGLRAPTPSTQDIRGGVLAMVDGDPSTAWIAASSSGPSTFHLSWPRARTVRRVALRLSATAPAVPARSVVVSGGGSSRHVILDGHGAGRFRPLRTRRLTIRVDSQEPGYTLDGATRAALPLGVGELAVYGSKRGVNLVGAAGTPLRGACGSGPTLGMGELEVRTRFRAVLGASTDDVTVTPCRHRVTLPAGTVSVVARANSLISIDHVGLQASPPGRPTTPPAIGSWGDGSRTIEVPGAPERRLLVVSQNYNAGWRATLDGHTLTPQEIDGWRQGWWLPPDSGGTVDLRFTPQPRYVAGLAVGAVSAVMVLLLLLLGPRRHPRAPTALRGGMPLVVSVVLMAGVGGFLAGWWGAVSALVITALGHLPRVAPHAWVTGALGVLACGAITTLARVHEGLTNSEVVQVLLVASLAAAVPVSSRESSAPRRPPDPNRRVFRRRKGLSTT
jgi:arabinofuranan 3-O-arabinosyltransferase